MGACTIQRPNPLKHGHEVTVPLSSLLHKFQDRSTKSRIHELSEAHTKNKVHEYT